MSNPRKALKITPALCTQCGAQIEVDLSQAAAICPHCKTAFIVENAVKKYKIQYIQNANVEHIDTVNINTTNQVNGNSVLYFIDKHLDRLNKNKMEALKTEKDKLSLEKERILLKRLENEEKQREKEYRKRHTPFILRVLAFLFRVVGKIVFWVFIAIVGLIIIALLR